MYKISVCIATYNGEKYIKEQLVSILSQIGFADEVIISDDCSSDSTLAIIEQMDDERIKVLSGTKYSSLIFNFENALKNASGDYVFLSDQDDIWLPDKVKTCVNYLQEYDLVVSDATVVDKSLSVINKSFFNYRSPLKGFFCNIIRNPYLGCCLAFKRNVLKGALPFPEKIAMHDIWIGLYAETFHNTFFIDQQLILYRRHGNNASCASENSNLSFFYKIKYRLQLLYYLFIRFLQR